MASSYDYDLFVIGAGSGGVRAARMAAMTGARVAVAEDIVWAAPALYAAAFPRS